MYGSQQTGNATLQPYALLAIICGLESDCQTMLKVESSWQQQIDQLTTIEGLLAPDVVCQLDNSSFNHIHMKYYLCPV